MDMDKRKDKNIRGAASALKMIREEVKKKATSRHPLTAMDYALTCGIWALEKQTPMKVEEVHVDEYVCPACGAENLNGDFKKICYHFCPMCGQAIYQEN